jgi:uncharacterized membrane protein
VTLKVVLGVALLVLVGIQFFGPARTNPASSPTQALAAKVSVPDDVQKVLARSCADCHSHATHWPWYSYVAPVAWGVIGDVNNGRDHLDMSDWRYSPEEGAELIDGICKQVRRRRMPLTAYLWMHRDAKLTDEEIKLVCAWSKDAAEQLVPSH